MVGGTVAGIREKLVPLVKGGGDGERGTVVGPADGQRGELRGEGQAAAGMAGRRVNVVVSELIMAFDHDGDAIVHAMLWPEWCRLCSVLDSSHRGGFRWLSAG